MYKKSLAILSASLACFTLNAHAAGGPPEVCPGIAAIQEASARLKVEKDEQEGWIGYQNNSFDTDAPWSFLVGAVEAKDEVEAKAKLSASLASLTLTKGPIFDREFGIVECNYDGANNIKAVALWPPVLPNSSLLKR